MITGNEPKEVIEAATRVHEALKRKRKSDIQLEGWKRESELADANFSVAQAEYADILNRWDTVSDWIRPAHLENAPEPRP